MFILSPPLFYPHPYPTFVLLIRSRIVIYGSYSHRSKFNLSSFDFLTVMVLSTSFSQLDTVKNAREGIDR